MSLISGSVHPVVTSPQRYDEQEVIPIRDRAFVPQPGYIKDGFPQRPMFWVRNTSLASLDGQYLSSVRIDPTEVSLPFHTRFIPSGWDDISGIWQPYVTNGQDYFFRSPPGLAPNSEEIEYRIGKEIIRTPALRFNPGDYLLSSFNNGVDQAAEFTLVLVAMLYPPLQYTVFSTQNDVHEISVGVDNVYKLHYGTAVTSLKRNTPPGTNTPVYILLSSNGYTATLYVAHSTKTMLSTSIVQQDLDIPRMKFTIGKTRLGKAMATMSLIEFALFDRAISTTSSPSLTDVVSQLSGAYGAS